MNSDTSTILTRERLYELAWQRPLSVIAAELGITGTGLRKICDRYNIPVPPRGHWAKVQHGKPVVTRRLPAPPEGFGGDIVIRRTPAPIADQAPVIEDAPDVALVSQPGRHPLIKAWREDYRAQKHGGYLHVTWTDIDDRQMIVLATAFKAWQARGFKVEPYVDERRPQLHQRQRGWFWLVDADVRIECRLREKLRQVRQAVPIDRRYIYGRDWQQRLEPAGILHFEIKSYLGTGHGLRRQWEDKAGKTIEDQLGEIIVTVAAAKHAVLAVKRYHDDLRKRVADEAEAAAERRRVAETEVARRAALEALAGDLERVESLRRLLAAIEPGVEPERVYGEATGAEWLAWIQAIIEDVDPLSTGPAGLFSVLTIVKPSRS